MRKTYMVLLTFLLMGAFGCKNNKKDIIQYQPSGKAIINIQFKDNNVKSGTNDSIIDELKNHVSSVNISTFSDNGIEQSSKDYDITGGKNAMEMDLSPGKHNFSITCYNNRKEIYFVGGSDKPIEITSDVPSYANLFLTPANSINAEFTITGIPWYFKKKNASEHYTVSTSATSTPLGITLNSVDNASSLDKNNELHFKAPLQVYPLQSNKLLFTVLDKDGRAFSQLLDVDTLDTLRKINSNSINYINYLYKPGGTVNIDVKFLPN